MPARRVFLSTRNRSKRLSLQSRQSLGGLSPALSQPQHHHCCFSHWALVSGFRRFPHGPVPDLATTFQRGGRLVAHYSVVLIRDWGLCHRPTSHPRAVFFRHGSWISDLGASHAHRRRRCQFRYSNDYPDSGSRGSCRPPRGRPWR
jgi:hypothetical protein